MSVLNNSNAIETGGYNIQRSLRFRSSASAYLSKAWGANGNRQKWTWSGWVKRGQLGATKTLFGATNTTSDAHLLQFTSSDTLQFMLLVGGSFSMNLITTQVFRDPSAWYHIEVNYDSAQATASNRAAIYVNGVQVTSFGISTYPAQNTNGYISGTTYTNYIGYDAYFDGYLAEVNFIDGQALTPSSFGQTDPVTGVWTPKKYTGTYGTNGFYLDFKDNTSATTLAYDKSGNGNNWTPNNISTTAGATYDSMTDVPTLTSASAANYCVINPLDSSAAPTGGNLNVGAGGTCGTFAPSTGKWYAEYTCTNIAGGSVSNDHVGLINEVHTAAQRATTGFIGSLYRNDGTIYTDGGTVATSGAAWGVNDVVGIAWDFTARTIQYYKNGVSQGTTVAMNSSVAGYMAWTWISVGWADTGAWNFGQRPFSYTPPTGFKALNTFNLPDPTIKKPNQYMDATTYTGNGGTQSITNGGFQPDFVWMKKRSAAESHILQNSTTGTTKFLMSNSTAAEDTSSAIIQSFDASGFTVGASSVVNGAATTYVGWQWKKGATPGFDIVTYTGNGTAGRTVNHSLGVTPAMQIVKCRSNAATNWATWQKSLLGSEFLYLNTTGAKGTGNTSLWNGTAPNSTTFTVGTDNDTNANGYTYVAYLFAEIAGFSKFGSYTGNGSSDGPFVYCGFRPKFIMFKASTTTTNWVILDTTRDTYNAVGLNLYPNLSAAEDNYRSVYPVDILSNGLKIRANYGNLNNNTSGYIFAAFAENPFKYSLAR